MMKKYLFGLFKVFENDREVENFLAEQVRTGKWMPCLIYVKNSDGRNKWEASRA